jgi:glycosyltransferase involved in cell wall biosynthesis
MQDVSSSSPHRVAFVTGGLKLGGSTTFLCNLAGEFIRRGVPAGVFSFERENPLAADFQRLNIPIQVWNERRLIFEDRLRQVLQRLAAFQPTVVVANLGPVSFEVLRYLPPGIFRIGMGQSDDPIVYDMMRLYTPWMDLAAMVSQTMRQKAAAMPEFARVPVAYLAYGVPMCLDTELPARDFTAPLRILYLGRLEQEQKRVRLFPEILRQLCAAGISFHWTIAGEGGERGFLEANLKPVSPNQTVSFAGPVRYADVPALLKQHDICLLTSDYEGFGLCVVESMGYGLVPVVSDLPAGIPEMVDKTTGILVPVDDVAGYARAIVHLHEHRDELAAKSAASRERVKMKFSVEAMTDRWLAALPATAAPPSAWPQSWKITAPLTAGNSIYFSLPMRALRRVAARFRN